MIDTVFLNVKYIKMSMKQILKLSEFSKITRCKVSININFFGIYIYNKQQENKANFFKQCIYGRIIKAKIL